MHALVGLMALAILLTLNSASAAEYKIAKGPGLVYAEHDGTQARRRSLIYRKVAPGPCRGVHALTAWDRVGACEFKPWPSSPCSMPGPPWQVVAYSS